MSVLCAFLFLLTYVHSHVGDFICFTAFQGRDYMLSGREGEEKHCPGGRLPLNAGELTVLHLLVYMFTFI